MQILHLLIVCEIPKWPSSLSRGPTGPAATSIHAIFKTYFAPLHTHTHTHRQYTSTASFQDRLFFKGLHDKPQRCHYEVLRDTEWCISGILNISLVSECDASHSDFPASAQPWHVLFSRLCFSLLWIEWPNIQNAWGKSSCRGWLDCIPFLSLFCIH